MTSPSTGVEQAKFWRDPILSDTEMLRATYVTHSFSRHTHEGYAIGVIDAGVEAFAYRGATQRAGTNQIVIVHPGEVHTGQAGVPDGWQYRMLYPDVNLVQRAAQSVYPTLNTLPFFHPVITDPDLASQLRRLHIAVETSSERAASELERESRFLWTLAHLIQRHAIDRPLFQPVSHPPLAVQTLREYLESHYAEPIRLTDLAQLVQQTPLQLLRAFQRQMGLPPHAYLIQVRIQHAKQLLRLGQPIAQVAIDTGFTDQSHLNRHFKRLVGITPKQYALGWR